MRSMLQNGPREISCARRGYDAPLAKSAWRGLIKERNRIMEANMQKVLGEIDIETYEDLALCNKE